MTAAHSNVSVTPNVMIEGPDGTQDLRALPGNFAFAIYKVFWTSPDVARAAMTAKQ